MSDKNDNINKLTRTSKTLTPRRCASSTGLLALNYFQNLTLREARSCTGTMAEFKFTDSEKQLDETLESNYCDRKHDCEGEDKTGIPTVDISTNEIFYVKDAMLTQNGKKYSTKDIASKWKKDCRKWLWKNNQAIKTKYVEELKRKK